MRVTQITPPRESSFLNQEGQFGLLIFDDSDFVFQMLGGDGIKTLL